jgi:hypothetical protein
MTHLKLDRIAGTTTSTGTGALTLDATAVDGYSRFQDVMNNGDTMHVMVVDRTTKVRQGGLYTYNAGALTLTTLLSSTTGAQINFGAGTKDLFDYAPAAKTLVEDNNGDASVTRDFTVGRDAKIVRNILMQGGEGTALSFSPDLTSQYVKYSTSLNGLKINGYSAIVFENNIGEISRWGSSGYLALGTNSQAQRLNINGSIYMVGGGSTALTWSSDLSSQFVKFDGGLNGLIIDGFGGVVFNAAASEAWRVDGSGDFRPYPDNTRNIGSASFRAATIYAGVGTINTSDENDKTNIRPLTDAETAVAVALASKVQVWQWKDSVAAKGVDGARLHGGLTAQTVRDTFIAGGLEPFRYGCVGFDAISKTESYTETVQRPKMQTVDVEEQSVEIVNGVPTLVTKTVEQSQPVGALAQVVDANGQPVTVPTGRTDEEGQPIMAPMLHFVPEMESVDEPRTRTVPELDANGEPVLRMNVRPDQLAMWIAHGVAYRLAALEAKVA